MLTRVLSGFVLGGAVLALLLYLSWHYFIGLIVAVALIGQFEYQRMFSPQRSMASRLGLAVLTVLLAVSPVLGQLNLPQQLYVTAIPTLWALVFCIIALGHISKPLPIEESAKRAGLDALGIFYLGATLTGIVSLRLLNLDEGWGWVLLAMLITFGGDTGGYFAGRALGGKIFGARRLAPQLSPKKTWEGYIGGILLGTCGALIARSYFPICQALSLVDCFVLGGVGVSLGVTGDLFESMLKRASGVKDSGNLIPGHGGVLDRVDALLFVAPALYCYLALRFAS